MRILMISQIWLMMVLIKATTKSNRKGKTLEHELQNNVG